MADKATKKTVDKWRSLIEHSWKGLDKEDLLDYINPFHLMSEKDRDNPDVYLLNLMRKPENFAFTCKFLFNVELMPFQGVILQTLWNSSFPIFLASRGGSKCIKGDTIIQTETKFCPIKDIAEGPEQVRQYSSIRLFGENGYKQMEYGWNNGFSNTKLIKTRCGFELESTLNHPIRVVRGDKLEWVNTEDVRVGDYIPISRDETWLERPTHMDIDTAYRLGCDTKDIPLSIWCSQKEAVASFLLGLFKTKGTFQEKISLKSDSINLKHVQFLLTKFGIITTHDFDNHTLYITGDDVQKFSDKILKQLNCDIRQDYYYDVVKSIEDSYCQTYDVHIPDDHSFISNGFISHNSYTSALYLLLRAIFLQGRKIVIIAPGFRQAKNVMNYIEGFWNNSPVLQDLFQGAPIPSGPRHDSDRWTLRVGYSTINALPLGIDGDRIRGERSNDTFIEEIQSFGGTEVLERVVGGFSIVSSNPVEKVKQAARIEAMKSLGLIDDKQADDIKLKSVKNQQIMCGTAYYEWNHFAQYHAKWKRIIESRGDMNKIKDIFTNQDGVLDIPDGFDWRDYSIIRIPVEMLPKNYMDEAQVARARATMHVGLYEMEYQTLFVRDSNGFYKATLIDGATANDKNLIQWGKMFGENMDFNASLTGKSDYKYVFGIDPASERDNFAITILELHKKHRRIVYCWTFNKKKHRALVNSGSIQETDYYGYCARKIRELLRVFPSEHIGIDSQGGISVMEALHSRINILEGEELIWPAITEEEQDTDNYPGLHIIYPVHFANAKWTSESNHGMRKDLEDKKLIFPMFDSVSLMQASQYLKNSDTEGIYTSLEDVMMEIEEMKSELISIVMTTTKNGTERWDTPEVKISGQKKGNQLKDRYSSLLIANSVARSIDKLKPLPYILDGEGNFVGARTYGASNKKPYNAPEWFDQSNIDNYGFA